MRRYLTPCPLAENPPPSPGRLQQRLRRGAVALSNISVELMEHHCFAHAYHVLRDAIAISRLSFREDAGATQVGGNISACAEASRILSLSDSVALMESKLQFALACLASQESVSPEERPKRSDLTVTVVSDSIDSPANLAAAISGEAPLPPPLSMLPTRRPWEQIFPIHIDVPSPTAPLTNEDLQLDGHLISAITLYNYAMCHVALCGQKETVTSTACAAAALLTSCEDIVRFRSNELSMQSQAGANSCYNIECDNRKAHISAAEDESHYRHLTKLLLVATMASNAIYEIFYGCGQYVEALSSYDRTIKLRATLQEFWSLQLACPAAAA